MSRHSVVLAVMIWAGLRLACAGDATTAEKAQAQPTWQCLGITWPYAGDDNKSGKVSAQFRRAGTNDWRPALDLFRQVRKNGRMFAGSIFRLAPGTSYEIKLALNDDDGGSTEQV